MRRNSPLAILAIILLSGCAGPQPETVYVDLDQVLASQRTPALDLDPKPTPPPPKPPVTVKESGFPATRQTDRTLARLELAKRLIAENREQSIASVSRLLQRVYLARAEDEIAKREQESMPSQDAFLDAAFAELRAAFEQWGEDRGPLLAELNIMANGNLSLTVKPVPEDTPAIPKLFMTRANELRREIAQLDAQYDERARVLFEEAQQKIDVEITRLRAEAARARLEAEDQALRDARAQVSKSQAPLDVAVKQLVPTVLPAVPSHQVTIPGTSKLPEAPEDTKRQIFGSLEQRRHLIDEEVKIWIASSGKKRSTRPQGARDATDEFLRWRSAHTVGP